MSWHRLFSYNCRMVTVYCISACGFGRVRKIRAPDCACGRRGSCLASYRSHWKRSLRAAWASFCQDSIQRNEDPAMRDRARGSRALGSAQLGKRPTDVNSPRWRRGLSTLADGHNKCTDRCSRKVVGDDGNSRSLRQHRNCDTDSKRRSSW